MTDLSDLDLVRREAQSRQAMVDLRFDKLEEIIESYEEQIAGLLAGYAELTALVDSLFTGIEKSEGKFEDLPKHLMECLEQNRVTMMKLLEGVNESNMDPRDTSVEGSVEDVAEQD